MRHTGMYVVELGVGIGKGGESCRRKKGKRIVEERRGRICEISVWDEHKIRINVSISQYNMNHCIEH